MSTPIQSKLGIFKLPPTPKPANTLTDYQQAVSVWTRQAEQQFKQLRDTFISLDTTQIPEAPGGGVFFTDALARAAVSATSPLLYDVTTGIFSIQNAAADGATKGAAAFTAADFNATSGVVSIDYTNAQKATASVPGFLTAADWTTFNSKVSPSRLINTTSPLAGGGDLSADRTLSIADAAADGSTKGAAAFTAADFNATSGVVSIDYTNGQAADATHKGFLTAADWSTFNGKQNALTFGNLTAGSTKISIGGTGTGALIGTGASVDVSEANLTISSMGGTLAATHGGTGQTTVTIGDILYGSASNVWSKLADVATGNALISGGVGAIPSWGKIGLTTHVSGTLAVGSGGTGQTSFTAGRILFGAGSSAINTASDFFWDNTNKRLGIGVAAPIFLLSFPPTLGEKLSLYDSGAASDFHGFGINPGVLSFRVPTSSHAFVFYNFDSSTENEVFRIYGTGDVLSIAGIRGANIAADDGLGNISALLDGSAGLHLSNDFSGSVPAILFDAATLTATPVEGSLEFDGSVFYFTQGGTRYPFSTAGGGGFDGGGAT